LLSVWAPQAALKVTFFTDLVVHVRLLLALPIYLLVVPYIDRGIQWSIYELVRRDIVDDRESYAAILSTVRRLLDSNTTDAVLILLAFARSFVYFRIHPGNSWIGINPATSPSPAGWWYAVVALPIVYFVSWWWIWRILVWIYFLARVARFNLNLVAAHPDRAGGIGFIATTQSRFAFLAFGGSAVLSANIAMLILVRGHKLDDFSILIPMIVLAEVALIVAPLLLFSQQMASCARAGKRTYGRLGTEYARDFEGKWIAKRTSAEPLLGSADIQSLADLANSYEVVSSMRILVLKRSDAIRMVAIIAAPFAPLLLTVLPAKEALRLLLSLIK